MSFASSLSIWIAVATVFAVAAAFGFRVLDRLGFERDVSLEAGLLAAGISFPLIGFVVFGLSIPGWLGGPTAWGLIAALAIAAWSGWVSFRDWAALLLQRIRSRFLGGSPATRILIVLLALTIALEALVSLAPLTGSDAMHYHFTTPLLEMGKPLQPIFWLSHSFLVEQAHLLISLGMALGAARISLGLILLGGLLTAAVLFAIARSLVSFELALAAVVTFLISPMVFWQITTSGSPDIWMGFYAGLAVVAARRGIESDHPRYVLLAGYFAGAAAGVKYTAWVVPLALFIYLCFSRRGLKLALSCSLVSFAAGALAQVRNLFWTGDPFFPFLMPRLNPASLNYFAWNALVSDTRSAGFSRGLLHLLAFPFVMALDGNKYGLGQYFGPVVIAFAPLLFLARWKTHTAKLAGIIWALALASIAVSTQMGRFLLPVFIFALALVFSGFEEMRKRGWKVAARASAATLILFFAFAGFSDLLYARDFLPVVFRRENKEAFLRRMAPEYQFVSFINSALANKAQGANGNAMVFLRHLYYLQVPYVYGDPAFSWAVDPAKCSDSEGLLRVLRDLRVRWVVKEPDYPLALEASFNQLEAEKRLVPIASADLETLTGRSRIYRETRTVRVTILELKD